MRRIISIIFRQYDVGEWWGALSQTLAQIMAFITVFNLALLIPTAYVTWFAPWAQKNGWNVPFSTFLLTIFIISIITLLLGYKLLTPSSFAFWNRQFWKHRNPIRITLAEMRKTQERQDKRMRAIEKAQKEILELVRK